MVRTRRPLAPAGLLALALVAAACSGGSPHRKVAGGAGRGGVTTPAAGAGDPTTSTSDAAAATTTTSAGPASAASPATTGATTPPTTRRSSGGALGVPTTARPAPGATASTAKPAPAALAGAGPTIGGCPVFPADNVWNRDVSGLPVDPSSAAYVNAISASGARFLHPDFGSDPTYGIPFVVQNGTWVGVTYDAYGDESDPGPVPIPLNAPIESGSDAHAIGVDTGTCTLFELYQARPSGHAWVAGSGAKWNLRSDALRPDGWTSADAAGLPILPGLVRFDEVQAGHIDHALRFTVARSQKGFMHPATHFASSSTDPSLPPMGLRLRLSPSYDISQFHGEARVVLEALRRYGMIVADNGTSWYVTGARDSRWNDEDLNQLKSVPGSAFEVVQTGEPIRR